MRRLLVLFALAAAAGCGDMVGPGAQAVTDLAAARQRWAAKGYRDYAFTYRAMCFCATTTPVQVIVVNDTVRSVVDPQTGAARDVRTVYSVSGMFDFIDRELARPADVLRVTYDPVLGYPTEVDYDGSYRIADDEATFTITDVRPIAVTVDRYGTAPAAPARRGSAPAVTFPFSIFTAEP